VPFISINIPDQMLTDLIDSAESLETQIGDVGDLAEQASVLLDDASQLFSGDFGESRESLVGFLADVEAYQEKVAGWREQIADLKESLPVWIDLASLLLTIFLLWFGLSQVSLLLHGRALLRGENPWEGWRK
jgi:ABC-type transporter Mla subunit MlaD